MGIIATDHGYRALTAIAVIYIKERSTTRGLKGTAWVIRIGVKTTTIDRDIRSSLCHKRTAIGTQGNHRIATKNGCAYITRLNDGCHRFDMVMGFIDPNHAGEIRI